MYYDRKSRASWLVAQRNKVATTLLRICQETRDQLIFIVDF